METDKDLKQYELAVLVKNEEDLAGIAAFLGQHQATVTGEPKIKKIALAYPVKKVKEAFFASYLFTALPDNAKAMEQDFAVRHEVLRAMIINAVTPNERRAPMGDIAALRRRAKPMTRTTAPATTAPKQAAPAGAVTNEALEKRIEEILQ
jgi:ribosomal protein S6